MRWRTRYDRPREPSSRDPAAMSRPRRPLRRDLRRRQPHARTGPRTLPAQRVETTRPRHDDTLCTPLASARSALAQVPPPPLHRQTFRVLTCCAVGTRRRGVTDTGPGVALVDTSAPSGCPLMSGGRVLVAGDERVGADVSPSPPRSVVTVGLRDRAAIGFPCDPVQTGYLFGELPIFLKSTRRPSGPWSYRGPRPHFADHGSADHRHLGPDFSAGRTLLHSFHFRGDQARCPATGVDGRRGRSPAASLSGVVKPGLPRGRVGDTESHALRRAGRGSQVGDRPRGQLVHLESPVCRIVPPESQTTPGRR